MTIDELIMDLSLKYCACDETLCQFHAKLLTPKNVRLLTDELAYLREFESNIRMQIEEGAKRAAEATVKL